MITIVTAASKAYWPLQSLTLPNKLEYCLRHQIQLVARVHDDNVITTAKPERLQFIFDALEKSKDGDWVWFMGSDTLIMNMAISVHEMLAEYNDANLVIAKDVNGINNDSFFVRSTYAGMQFVSRAIDACPNRSDDQEAMRFEMMDMSYGLKVKCVSQKLFNAYKYDEYQYGPQPDGTWEPGDLVLHLPGLPMERRMTLVRDFLPLVMR